MRKLSVLFAFTQAAQDVQAKYEADRTAVGSGQLLHPAWRGIRVLANLSHTVGKAAANTGPGRRSRLSITKRLLFFTGEPNSY
jgi:hypothetical protein